jgi:hypothetical protein
MAFSELALGRVLRRDLLVTPREPNSEISLAGLPELHPGGKGFKIITRTRTLKGPNEGFIGEIPPGIEVACLARRFDDDNPRADFIAWRTEDLNITVEPFSGAPHTQRRRGAERDRKERVEALRRYGHKIVAERNYPGGIILVVARYPQPEPAPLPIGEPISNATR